MNTVTGKSRRNGCPEFISPCAEYDSFQTLLARGPKPGARRRNQILARSGAPTISVMDNAAPTFLHPLPGRKVSIPAAPSLHQDRPWCRPSMLKEGESWKLNRRSSN